jgi:hypothetical protein
MVEWKIRSKIYHAMTPDTGDSLANEIVIEEWDQETIINRAREYWQNQTKELYYPAKSYAIAVTYAILLGLFFGGDCIAYLKDSDLLANNDPYFEPYSEKNKIIYEELIETYSHALKKQAYWSENYKKTIDYFYKEFLIHEETRHYLPSELS